MLGGFDDRSATNHEKELTRNPMQINPAYGGKLINRVLEGRAREQCRELSSRLPRVQLNGRQLSDVELISIGAFSPLEGFMNRQDYKAVLADERLANGLPWTIPVTLATSKEMAEIAAKAGAISLVDAQDQIIAVLEVEQTYGYDKDEEARSVLKTASEAHPGVRYLQSVGSYCIAGRISLLQKPDHSGFANHILEPKETRYLFAERGWKTVVAFQTRNPVHRAHEYILKCALETVDGLLLHPLIGDTREEDVPPTVRVRCYRALLGAYLPSARTVLSLYPAAMRYAGPREAIFHAIARKNYGCSHFIVGRDHAGVGNFYGPFDAQSKFCSYAQDELGIQPICFDATFYCRRCGQMASEKTCGHGAEHRLGLSGTKVREMLQNGEELPFEFTRPEIAAILGEAYGNSSHRMMEKVMP